MHQGAAGVIELDGVARPHHAQRMRGRASVGTDHAGDRGAAAAHHKTELVMQRVQHRIATQQAWPEGSDLHLHCVVQVHHHLGQNMIEHVVKQLAGEAMHPVSGIAMTSP